MAKQETQAEALSQLAESAREGAQGMVLLGKLKGLPNTSVSQTTGEKRCYGDIITGEGDTLSVQFDPDGKKPGVAHVGAFLVTPRMFRGDIRGLTVVDFA